MSPQSTHQLCMAVGDVSTMDKTIIGYTVHNCSRKMLGHLRAWCFNIELLLASYIGSSNFILTIHALYQFYTVINIARASGCRRRSSKVHLVCCYMSILPRFNSYI